jgi:PAS domain S-box-containing protein
VAAGLVLGALNSLNLSDVAHAAFLFAGGAIALPFVVFGLFRLRPSRSPLGTLLPLALAIWVAASFVDLVSVQPGFSDTAKVLWLVASVLLVPAVLVLLLRDEPWRAVFVDIASLVATLGVVASVFLVVPYLETSELPLFERITQVGYGASDIVLGAVVLRLLVAPRPRNRAALMVGGSMVALLCSDLVWNWLTLDGQYVNGTWADAGWIAFPLLLAAAVLHPSMAELVGERPPRRERLAVSSAIILGGATLSTAALHAVVDIHAGEAGSNLFAVTGVALVVAVLVMFRVGSLIRQSQRLSSRLRVALDERDRELAQSQERYRALVERMPAVIYLLREPSPGERPVAVYVSPQSQAIIGLDADELVATGDLFERSVHPDDTACFLANRNSLRQAGQSAEVEFRIVRPDGEELWLRAAETAVRSDDGTLSIQGILTNVTARKTAEFERDRMELDLRLAQKLESVGQLAAGVAHEINTPIQFVGDTVRFLDDAFGDVTALLEQYGRLHHAAREGRVDDELLEETAAAEDHADVDYLAERVPQAFGRANDGIARIAGIVGAMRAFAHPPTSEKAPVDINEALRTTLIVAANEYRYTADVETDFADLPPVVCDAGDMNQVFLNLVVNAAHAIQDVVGDTGERGTITIGTRTEGPEAVITVGDTGPGIPADIVNRVFDPFFTTKEIGRGTGQGLALVRSIVADKHEGHVTVHTSVGGGTTLEIRLPLDVPAALEMELVT